MTGAESERRIDRFRRRELAKEALEVQGFAGIDEDPYWLCNLHGRVNTADMAEMAETLRSDAELLETAVEKIEAGEWLPEEAALHIAENAKYGDYETRFRNDWTDHLPITEEP